MDMCGNQNKDQYYVLCQPMRQTERWWRQSKEAGIKSIGRKIKGTLHDIFDSTENGCMSSVALLEPCQVLENYSISQFGVVEFERHR